MTQYPILIKKYPGEPIGNIMIRFLVERMVDYDINGSWEGCPHLSVQFPQVGFNERYMDIWDLAIEIGIAVSVRDANNEMLMSRADRLIAKSRLAKMYANSPKKIFRDGCDINRARKEFSQNAKDMLFAAKTLLEGQPVALASDKKTIH